MGLPVGRSSARPTDNDVLAEFTQKRASINKTGRFGDEISPSMDILVSKQTYERLLFDLGGKDDGLVSRYMKDLSGRGVYEVAPEIRAAIGRDFGSGWSSDGETKATIRALFESSGYLIDTHTAVAFSVLRKYREETKDGTHTVVVSTASPFKFCDSVLDALGADASVAGLGLLGRLEEAAGVGAPAPLRTLEGKPVRFSERVGRSEMTAAVEAFLDVSALEQRDRGWPGRHPDHIRRARRRQTLRRGFRRTLRLFVGRTRRERAAERPAF
jgi:threonine synthase